MIGETFKNWNGAIVYLTPKGGGKPFVDCAAHVFECSDGFAYVNPGYIYPETAHLNNFHRISATLRKDGDRITFDGQDYSGYMEEWEAEAAQLKAAGDALHYYENELTAQKTDYAGERARVAALLEEDIR